MFLFGPCKLLFIGATNLWPGLGEGAFCASHCPGEASLPIVNRLWAKSPKFWNKHQMDRTCPTGKTDLAACPSLQAGSTLHRNLGGQNFCLGLCEILTVCIRRNGGAINVQEPSGTFDLCFWRSTDPALKLAVLQPAPRDPKCGQTWTRWLSVLGWARCD